MRRLSRGRRSHRLRQTRETNGFTLIEMLVALVIFGLLSAGAVLVLSFSLRSAELSRDRLDDVASLRRLNAVFMSDLAQVAPRIWRDELGQRHAAFLGNFEGSGGFSAAFIRRDATVPDDSARPSIQKIVYFLDGENLRRTSFRNVDGSTAMETITLLKGVKRAQLRFRTRKGEWKGDWNPSSLVELPSAAELTIESGRWGRFRQLFVVGTSQ